MLLGVDPLLTGDLLAMLDTMGHGDTICLADAHFPARRWGRPVLESPGVTTPRLLRAVATVLPIDDAPAVELMAQPDGDVLPVHRELAAAAGAPLTEVRLVDRFTFYDLAAHAYAIVRTGEHRVYANVIVRKGVVTQADAP